MKKLLCAVLVMAAGLFGMRNEALAAGNAEVAVKGTAFEAGTASWQVTCEINSDTKITNGKIRITYDSSQLKLTASGAGAVLNGALTNINDPVSGNKAEGELVLAFASSSELEGKGTLLELNFQVLGQVKAGDLVAVNVRTEELMDNSAAVSVTDVPLQITAGGTVQDPGTNDSGSGENPDDSGSGTEGQDTEKNDSVGIESVEKPGTGGGSGNTVTPGNNTTSRNNNVSSGNSQSSGQSKSANPVKTGDETNMLLPLAAFSLASAVLIAALIWKKKRKTI